MLRGRSRNDDQEQARDDEGLLDHAHAFALEERVSYEPTTDLRRGLRELLIHQSTTLVWVDNHMRRAQRLHVVSGARDLERPRRGIDVPATVGRPRRRRIPRARRRRREGTPPSGWAGRTRRRPPPPHRFSKRDALDQLGERFGQHVSGGATRLLAAERDVFALVRRHHADGRRIDALLLGEAEPCLVSWPSSPIATRFGGPTTSSARSACRAATPSTITAMRRGVPSRDDLSVGEAHMTQKAREQLRNGRESAVEERRWRSSTPISSSSSFVVMATGGGLSDGRLSVHGRPGQRESSRDPCVVTEAGGHDVFGDAVTERLALDIAGEGLPEALAHDGQETFAAAHPTPDHHLLRR